MARIDDNWFSFNGVSSANMDIRVNKLPDIRIAEEKGNQIDILGRDGALWQSEHAYKNIELNIGIEVKATTDPTTVGAWLMGSGELVLSSHQGQCYHARVIKGFDFKRAIYKYGYYAGTVTFTCAPFRYEIGNPAMADITSPKTFTGSGNVPSFPIITVYGSGEINLLVNDASLLLSNVSSSITIDCDALMATDANGNASLKVTVVSLDDEWPALKPDTNTINWSGSVSKVVIKPQWRWR